MSHACKAAILAGLLLAATAGAQNLSFLNKMPVSRLSEDDKKLFMAALQEALASDDEHAERSWSNPDTGSKGTLKVLRVESDYGTTCKVVRVENEVKGVKGNANTRLCRAPEGDWRLAPMKSKPAG